MSKVTLNEFIEYLESHVGDAYVWGSQSECISDMDNPYAWIRRMETSDKNADRAIAFVKKATKNPLYAFDCSGLGMYWIYNLKKISSGDISSNGMYGKCEKITKAELRKGDWVFRHNGTKVYHIGYVVDDDLNVIESMGRDVGVVKRPLNASGSSYWNKFGRPIWVFPELSKEPAANDEPAYTAYTTAKVGVSKDTSIYIRKKPAASTASYNVVAKISNAKGKSFSLLGENGDYYYAAYNGYKGFVRKQDFEVQVALAAEPFFAVVTGSSVNVRLGAGTHYAAVGVAHKDDRVLALPHNLDWSRISIVLDNEMKCGFISNKYIKKV